MIEVPVLVKDALRDGRLKKNYRFVVLDNAGSADFTIDNDTLVSESVKIDERMNSGDTLKFGLCEGSSLEFQYFNHPSINGKRVQSFIDVDYYSNSIERVQGESFVALNEGSFTFSSPSHTEAVIRITRNGSGNTIYVNERNNYSLTWVVFKDAVCTILQASDIVTITSDVNMIDVHTIPMGFFEVDKCPRQASTGIYKVTAFNKLKSTYLDAKANEKIIEIVNQGAVGGTDGVDVGTILDELLEGYSINRAIVPVNFTVSSETIPASDSSTIRHTDLSGTGNGPYIHSLDITELFMPDNFRSDNFYRFKINMKAVFDAVYGYAGTEHLNEWFKSTTNASNRDILDAWLKGTTSFIDSLYVGGFQFNTSNGFRSYLLQDYRNETEFYTPWFTNVTGLVVGITGLYDYDYNQTRTWTQNEIDLAKERLHTLLFDRDIFSIEVGSRSSIEKTIIKSADAESLPDVTLRQLQAAVFEINAQYGQIDRMTDLFEGVELNSSRLLPQDSLYPANDLYPRGRGIRGNRSTYSQLWTDNQGAQTFRNLIITYKGLDENNQAKDMTLQKTINANGTTDYVMSDNWLFKNLVWSTSDAENYANAMVNKMRDISWFPFEMWAAGLPYLETGDEIEITNEEGTYTSYILQRQLQGVQNLQDTFINGTLDVF